MRLKTKVMTMADLTRISATMRTRDNGVSKRLRVGIAKARQRVVSESLDVQFAKLA